jgi:hypothetical protein
MTGFNSKRKASLDTLDHMPYQGRETRPEERIRTSAARAIAAEQAEDAGLWFVATTVSEAHLQAALRRLTAAVEGEAPVARTPLTDEEIWMLATNCTIGGDLHIDKFARSVEQAHGIGDKT